MLLEFEKCEGNKVMMGNNSYCVVKGKGKVTIQNPDGSIVVLSNVRYMPEMGRNLISYGQLKQSGCRYTGRNNLVEFYKGDKKVLTGKYSNGLYYLQGTVKPAEANTSGEAQDHTRKWDMRLGHMNIRKMESLVKKGYIKDLDIGSLGFCEACAMGKSHKQKFPKAKHTLKEVLEYIHFDLWGSPSTVSSLSGAHSFLTFTDDFSKKVWIYFLSTKDEVYNCFAEWKLLVENQKGRKIKCLRTDNGLGFYNQRMDKLCRDSGIKRHKTCPYTPQENGVSERMNRSIMDKVRSMLQESGLDESYWAEAASTAVYLINRSLNASIGFEIPEERWIGATLSYDHLRSFGCIAYVHQVKEKTSSRASRGVFLGYDQGTKGYKVWLVDEERMIIGKDVVFNEKRFFKDLEKEGSQELDQPEQQPKKGKKKVTFTSDLVEFEGDHSDQGGAHKGDQGGDHTGDQEQKEKNT